MQLIKSLRSFVRWMFNIKDEVKPVLNIQKYGQYCHKSDPEKIVYVQDVCTNLVFYRHGNSLRVDGMSKELFAYTYRKIS